MARGVNFSSEEFYHLYNRGTERRDIFLDVPDYERFLALLYLCNQDQPVDIKRQGRTLSDLLDQSRHDNLVNLAAYCLMPNHFHVLVREKDVGNISKFIQKVTTGYTMYFNKKYERTGVLFQGKFKAKHVDTDRYLKYLTAYIHLNPVKLIDRTWKENGIRDYGAAKVFLTHYRYSSYIDFTAQFRKENLLLNKNLFLEYYDSPIDFETSVDDWLKYDQARQGRTLSVRELN